VIVKLQGYADDVVFGPAHQSGDDRGVDTPRHGHDDAQALSGGFAGCGSAWSARGHEFNHA
jgi:hypothetical protein